MLGHVPAMLGHVPTSVRLQESRDFVASLNIHSLQSSSSPATQRLHWLRTERQRKESTEDKPTNYLSRPFAHRNSPLAARGDTPAHAPRGLNGKLAHVVASLGNLFKFSASKVTQLLIRGVIGILQFHRDKRALVIGEWWRYWFYPRKSPSEGGEPACAVGNRSETLHDV